MAHKTNTYTCEHCKKKFESHKAARKYCSDECRQNSAKENTKIDTIAYLKSVEEKFNDIPTTWTPVDTIPDKAYNLMTPKYKFNCSEHGEFSKNLLGFKAIGCLKCKNKYKLKYPECWMKNAIKNAKENPLFGSKSGDVTKGFAYKIIEYLDKKSVKCLTATEMATSLAVYMLENIEKLPSNSDAITLLKDKALKDASMLSNLRRELKTFKEIKKIEDSSDGSLTKDQFLKHLLRMVENDNSSAAKLLAELEGFFDDTNELVIKIVQFDEINPNQDKGITDPNRGIYLEEYKNGRTFVQNKNKGLNGKK